MGRIRTIKPEFHAHEELSSLSPETHLLAAALMNYADDEGYFNANPVLVKAGTNPLRADRTKIEDQLNQLENIGYIEIRRAGVRCIGLICNFAQHQRVSHALPSKLKDKFESLPKFAGEPPEILRPEGELNGIELKGNRVASTASAVPASPAVITLSLLKGKTHIVTLADVEQYGRAYPAVNIRGELERIVAWLDANQDKRSDTIAGSKKRIVRWLSGVQDKGGSNGATQQNRGGVGRSEQALAELAKAGVTFADRVPESGAGEVRVTPGRSDGRDAPGLVLEGSS